MSEFQEKLNSWFEGAQEMVREGRGGIKDMVHKQGLTMVNGKRFIIVRRSEDGRVVSAYAFIVKDGWKGHKAGDVLKPASWSTPAKHARGNIFDDWSERHENPSTAEAIW